MRLRGEPCRVLLVDRERTLESRVRPLFRQGDLVDRPPFFYGHGGEIRLWDVGDESAGEAVEVV